MSPQPTVASEPNPLQAEVERLNRLQDKIALTEAGDALTEIEGEVNALPAKLAGLRNGSYAFKSYLEDNLAALTARWQDLAARAQPELLQQRQALQASAARIAQQHQRRALAAAALDALESQAEAAQKKLQATYTAVHAEVKQMHQQLDDAAWTLQQIGQASFSLAPGEAPVEAVPANWKKPDDKDGVEGVLFLTDRRLLFEQREEVATKKVLFITTAKQKLQSLQWDLPVAQLQSAAGAKKGFMGKDDYLTLTCVSDTPFRTADLHLKGESGEAWRVFIERVKSGAIEQERLGGAAAPAPDLITVSWGRQFLVPQAGGQVNLAVAGTGSYLARDPLDTRSAMLMAVLTKYATDVVGEMCAKGRSVEALQAARAEIGAAVEANAAHVFAAAGMELRQVVVEVVREVPPDAA